MTLEELFVSLSPEGQEKLVDSVKVKLIQLATPSGLNLNKYAATFGLEHNWVRLRNPTAKPEERARHWAKVCRRLRLSLPFDSLPRPWDRLAAGDTIVICLGQRLVSLPDVGANVQQRAVGARDVEALAELLQFIHRTLDLDCRVRIENVPVDISYEASKKWLQQMREDRSCGALIVIGSPIVNRLADPIAEAIFQGCDEGVDLPGRFRWSFDLHGMSPFLSEDEPCRPKDEGIRMGGDESTTYQRVRDEIVMREHQNKRRSVFADCGMLLCRIPPKGPFLILAAGHGGCGTIGAVLALCEQAEIAQRFDESDDDATFGRNRVCELIEVCRSKRSSRNFDDLELSRQMHVDGKFRSGWRFAVARERTDGEI